jgi:hypothetical protein
MNVDEIFVLKERILEPTEIALGGPTGYRIRTDGMWLTFHDVEAIQISLLQ